MKKYSAYSSKRQTNPEEVLRIYTETDLCYGIFLIMSSFSNYLDSQIKFVLLRSRWRSFDVMQNKTEYRTSLVSKSLPVKK